jgi:hypothetical protein
MLLTDGNPNTTEDLRVYESGILSVAHTEGIDLGVKLALATEELTQEVLEFLLNRSAGVDPRGAERRAVGVFDVVVTRQMKRWHALHTLAVVYRDAYFHQLNDRYKGMFSEYRSLAAEARRQTFGFGLGLVVQPVPVAAAPELGFAAGPFEARTYFVRVAWVGANGGEGLASAVTSYDAPSGSAPVVGLGAAPPEVTGFHVYMGLTPEVLARQTSAPVAAGQSFTLPPGGLVHGVAPGEGQAPDMFLTGARVMRRG